MGFYAACTKAVGLFRPAQHQQQTAAAASDNQAAAGLTETEKVLQQRRQIILLPHHLTSKQPNCMTAPHIQTDTLTTSQWDTALTCTQPDYIVGNVCVPFIKYNIQQRAEATPEQHLSTRNLTSEMRQQSGT